MIILERAALEKGVKKEKGKKKPLTFSQRVLLCVRAHSVATIDVVVAEVGRYISAATAAAATRRRWRYEGKKNLVGVVTRPRKKAIERGRRELVAWNLSDLTRQGRLVRIAPSTYAPSPPGSPTRKRASKHRKRDREGERRRGENETET